MKQGPQYALREATPEDFPFAEAIYIDSMRPLMKRLARWNETERRAALRRSFKVTDTSIIILDGRDIGWMQVTERDTDYNLAQLQLLDDYCGLGIGTRLIKGLLDRAEREDRTVSLSVIRINRAIGLYERLGFRIVDPEATPILDMVWGER
jgi:ribosomal protein S18 acetylase RimI-like enzyme